MLGAGRSEMTHTRHDQILAHLGRHILTDDCRRPIALQSWRPRFFSSSLPPPRSSTPLPLPSWIFLIIGAVAVGMFRFMLHQSVREDDASPFSRLSPPSLARVGWNYSNVPDRKRLMGAFRVACRIQSRPEAVAIRLCVRYEVATLRASPLGTRAEDVSSGTSVLYMYLYFRSCSLHPSLL